MMSGAGGWVDVVLKLLSKGRRLRGSASAEPTRNVSALHRAVAAEYIFVVQVAQPELARV